MASSDYVSLYGVDGVWEPYEGGAFQPRQDFGAIDEFALNITDEDIKHISRACGAVGLTDKTALSTTEILADILSPEISPRLLAKAFRGTLTETDVVAATDTETAVTIAAYGVLYSVGAKLITNVEVWDTTGKTGVQYTVGVDYNLDADGGGIVAIDGGGITVAQEIFVTFDNPAYTDVHIAAFKASAATGRLTIKACAVEGVTYYYVFQKVTLKLNGTYSLVNATDFVTIPLQATILADDGITDSSLSKTLNIYGADPFSK